MSKIKFGIKNYKGITPLKIRKITLAINSACMTAMGYSAVTENKTLSLILIGIFGLTYVVSECFAEDAK